MEHSHKNAPKTIRMKYPAPYSSQPSTKTDTDPPVTPKPTKRKTRMTSYSAQSWLERDKAGKRPASSRQTQSQQITNKINPRPPRRSSVQFGPAPGPRPCRPPIRRLDPEAQHLKYGVFPPPRKPSLIGNFSSAIISKPLFKKRAAPTVSVKFEKKATPQKQEGIEICESEDPSDVPTLVFRPISHRCTQRLSASDVFHLDIKPGHIGNVRQSRITVL